MAGFYVRSKVFCLDGRMQQYCQPTVPMVPFPSDGLTVLINPSQKVMTFNGILYKLLYRCV